jgi:hypothetical protein
VVVVLLIAGVCLAAGADASASAAPQNSASGGVGNVGVVTVTFNARSGPGGEAPTGDVYDTGPSPGSERFTGSVTCLSVHGYTAVIGVAGTATGPYGFGPNHPESRLMVAIDNAKPLYNMSVGYTQPATGADLFGATLAPAAPDCSMGSSVTVAPVTSGDVVVRDARDQPPRLTVPRAIRITVHTRRPVRVKYRVSAKDDFDQHPTLRCRPRSGSRFPVGTMLVRCTARDRSGLTRSAAFRVHVRLGAR